MAPRGVKTRAGNFCDSERNNCRGHLYGGETLSALRQAASTTPALVETGDTLDASLYGKEAVSSIHAAHFKVVVAETG